MSTISITMTDANGVTRTISDATTGITLMEVSKQNGVEGVLGNCGGGAACGTCHVYVDAGLAEAPASTRFDRGGHARNARGHPAEKFAPLVARSGWPMRSTG